MEWGQRWLLWELRAQSLPLTSTLGGREEETRVREARSSSASWKTAQWLTFHLHQQQVRVLPIQWNISTWWNHTKSFNTSIVPTDFKLSTDKQSECWFHNIMVPVQWHHLHWTWLRVKSYYIQYSYSPNLFWRWSWGFSQASSLAAWCPFHYKLNLLINSCFVLRCWYYEENGESNLIKYSWSYFY